MIFPKLPVVDPSTIKCGDMIDLETEEYYTEQYVDNTLNGLLYTVQSKFDEYSEDSVQSAVASVLPDQKTAWESKKFRIKDNL